MTIAHKFEYEYKGELIRRNKWKCDICGKEDFWGDSWSSYSSLALEETCPDDIPTACSDACFLEIKSRIKKRDMALPVLEADAGGDNVIKSRYGY